MQTFHVGNLRADQIAFTYSPGQEAILSLHILLDPKHHPLHIPWVMEARERLSPALKAEAEAFAILVGRPVASFWELHTDLGSRTFAGDLAALAALSPGAYAAEVIRVAYKEPLPWPEVAAEPVLQLKVLAATSTRAPQSLAMMQELLADPARSQQRFATFLAAYWERCLAHHWPQIEAMLLQEITRQGQVLCRRGPLGCLAGLTPEMAVDAAAGTAVLRRPQYADVRLGDEDELFLAPCYFLWPHVFARTAHPPLIAYAMPHLQAAGRPPVAPEELLGLLRAVGDATRLQILRLLAQSPRSTRELAGLLTLSEAAISKHLRQLQTAGWVTAERQSYYVIYHASRLPLADLTQALDALLGG